VLDAGLKSIEAATGSTIFVILLAALNLLMSRYTAQQEVTIGSPFYGRTNLKTDRIPGLFVNVLPLKNTVTNEMTFDDLLANVKDCVSKAQQNQDLSCQDIVSGLKLPRRQGRAVLYDMVFSVQDQNIPEINVRGLKFTPYEYRKIEATYDLVVMASYNKDEIRFCVDFCAGLFKKETVEMMCRDYSRILEKIAENSFLRIGDILLESEERLVKKVSNNMGGLKFKF
jgi:non-ribosomal peptide synthetase component F